MSDLVTGVYTVTFRTRVKNGVVPLPQDAMIADDTEVEVSVRPRGANLGDLLRFAGNWCGDDSGQIVDLIYRSRSSRDFSPFH